MGDCDVRIVGFVGGACVCGFSELRVCFRGASVSDIVQLVCL